MKNNLKRVLLDYKRDKFIKEYRMATGFRSYVAGYFNKDYLKWRMSFFKNKLLVMRLKKTI